MNFPGDLMPGDVCLYGGADAVDEGIEIICGDDVAHIEVYIGAGQSIASRNGIGVGKYPFRAEGLRYVYRPMGIFDGVAVATWFATVNGIGYGWGDILANLEPDGDGLATVDLRRCNGVDCSHFGAAAEEVAGCALFNPGYPKNKIKPDDFKKTPESVLLWSYKQPSGAAGNPS